MKSNERFSAMSQKEILNYLSKNKMKIGVAEGKYDATKIWLYNLLISNDIDIKSLDISEYKSQKDALKKLKNNELDYVVSDHHSSCVEGIGYNKTHTNTSDMIQPLNQLVIANGSMSDEELDLLSKMIGNIYKDSELTETQKDAYGTLNVSAVKGYESIEEQNQLKDGVKLYIESGVDNE